MIDDFLQIPRSTWLACCAAIAAAFALLSVRRAVASRLRAGIFAEVPFVVGAGFLLGAGTWPLREYFHRGPHPESLLALALMLLIGLRMAWHRRAATRLAGTGLLAVECAALWAGHFVGCTYDQESIWDDLQFAAAAGAALTFAIGAPIVLIRRRRRARDDESEPAPA